uniref:Uncharacterized protein n=1 Tax=Rhizophora mucronata TaxID=61149 RepID=A0A2P2PW96_RHIMU
MLCVTTNNGIKEGLPKLVLQ